MTELGSLLAYLRDQRLTAHATSAVPAWLWSVDARRVLWVNPTAAAIFDVASPAAIAGHLIDPKGTAALQIARLAATLPQGAAPRLERLRGFGASFGRPLMCACSRVMLDDRTPAILVVATEPVGPNLPLAERVRRLCAGIAEPIALFSTDGELIHATAAGEARLHGLMSIAALGAGTLADQALASGKGSGASHLGAISIERIGADASAVLLVMFPQTAEEARQVPTPAQPASAEPVTAQPSARAAATSEPPPQPTASQPQPHAERRLPLRFVWQMDAEGRFTLGSEEFAAVIGPQSAATLRRPWSEIAATLKLDPEGQILRAIASHDTWSGITVAFPVDGTDERLTVELSGLPVFDRERNFHGYRGFGMCRDVGRATEVMQARRDADQPPKAPDAASIKSTPRHEPPPLREERPALSVVPPIENVLPFRATPPEKSPTLTPVERKAFRELANRLTARLRGAQDSAASGESTLEQPDLETPEKLPPALSAEPPSAVPPGRGDEHSLGNDQRPILDRLPVGMLVYRLDKLIYANRAFLDWTGYESIHALADAGGLDALFVEPRADALGQNATKNGAQNGTRSLAITTSQGSQMPIEARLFSTPWDGEPALVLMLVNVNGEDRAAPLDRNPSLAEIQARELRSILDTAADGVVVLDREGRVISINRSAEALFGYQSRELSGLPFAGLFEPESQRAALDDIERLNQDGAGRVPDDGREVIARARQGGRIPLLMTMGRIAESADKLCAVFRDITPWKKAERELVDAKRQAEKASSAKSDFLAKVSHEIRTPLNAIIGFSEVMMEERFGAVGNERYKQYLKDIHTSGGHLISLLNDLLDLSKIEAGKLELNFTSLDLNELTQQCVALMQPQASRERIIIRTALSAALPPVLADARSVRQIALNLLSNSIKFTAAGGQVIVSTALNDDGNVVLRIRDTGVGMSEKDIAIALEPFRQLATSARWGSSGTGLGLPLTKALAEANRATFSIKSAVNAGTLIEVAFPGTQLAAE